MRMYSKRWLRKMRHVLAHRIGRALKPRGIGQSLLRRENFYEAMREMIEAVGLRDVPVQRGGVELGEQINTFLDLN